MNHIIDQDILNGALGFLSAILGLICKSMWDSIKNLQCQDIRLAEKVNILEVLVAGKYVTKEELIALQVALFLKLDRIETKIDNKVDK